MPNEEVLEHDAHVEAVIAKYEGKEEALEEPKEEAETKEEPAAPEVDPDAPKEEPEDKGAEAKEEDEEEVTGEENEKDRRLAIIARREKRQREQHEARKRELAEMESRLAEKEQVLRKAEEAFEGFKQRLRTDPHAIVELLEYLGVTERLADYALPLYAKEVPELLPKDAKAQMQLSQVDRRIKALEEENARLRSEGEERRRQEEEARVQKERVDQYVASMSEVAAQAKKDVPLVARMLEKNPEKARMRLLTLAESMYRQDLVIPEPEEVVVRLQEELQEELEALGAKGSTEADEEQADMGRRAAGKSLSRRATGRTTSRPAAQSEDELYARAEEALRRAK